MDSLLKTKKRNEKTILDISIKQKDLKMKAIKIYDTKTKTKMNEEIIKELVDKTLGMAWTHTHSFENIYKVAIREEEILADFDIPQSKRTGCIITCESGESLPRAYKYSRTISRIVIQRKSSAWFLVSFETCVGYLDAGERTRSYTQEQIDIIVKKIISKNNIVLQKTT